MTSLAYSSQADSAEAIRAAERRALDEDLALERAFVTDALRRIDSPASDTRERIRLVGEIRNANSTILRLTAQAEALR